MGPAENPRAVVRRRRIVAALALVAAAIALEIALAPDAAELVDPLGAGSAEAVGSEIEAAGPGCPPPRRGLTRRAAASGAVALTLDDGPGPQTIDAVRALERAEARATFFVLGRQIPGREGTLRAIAEAGHEIGNHSTSHDSMPSRADIETTSELIEAVVGRAPCAFRPPSGVSGPKLLRRVRELGMSAVGWSVDPSDYLLADSGLIRRRVLEAIEPGAIVLLHDAGGERSGTVGALVELVRALRRRGLEPVTVSELLDRSGDRAPREP